jgi:signal transduction histidine kinase
VSSIPPHEIATLFEPYRRGTTAGTGHGSMGLGLYIAREVIATHGGTIEVDSGPKAMTRFTVRLPRHAAPE